MLARQNAVLEAALRAQGFLEQNAALLLAVDFTTGRLRLDELVTSFTELALDQEVSDEGAEGETAKQRHLRRKLRRELMAPIAVIARWSLRNVREFKLLQMPKPWVRGREFTMSARAMADAAAVHRDRFVAYGLPATFLDDFQAVIGKLEDALDERDVNRLRRFMATRSLAAAERDSRKLLRVLDALVQQAAEDKESLLRSWREARHIRVSTAEPSTPAEAA